MSNPKPFQYRLCIFYCINHRCQSKMPSMNCFLPLTQRLFSNPPQKKKKTHNHVSSRIQTPPDKFSSAKCGFHLLFLDLYDCAKVQVCQLSVISCLDESLASSKDPDVFYCCLLRLLFRNTKSNFEIN